MTAYRAKYGNWAGNPKGNPPDMTRCCVLVYPNERGPIPYQCRRKRGFGPDGEYCKQHDPAEVAKREKATSDKYNAELLKFRYQHSGRMFYNALKEIADGHNDARGLAQEVIAKFQEGDR